MKNRSELREIIVKVLYQTLIYDEAKIDYDVNDLIKEQLEVENDFVNSVASGVLKDKKTLINYVNKYLVDWTFDRLSKVDQAIILVGVYELTSSDTPAIVAINEAVELSKKYSDEAVTKMINGVLDKIYHEEEK